MTITYKDGTYYDMPEATYHALPRLSSHGISKLLINPHDYWIGSFMNKNRKEKKSKAFSAGKLYEVIYLEGVDKFKARFCPEFDASKFPDVIDTVSDLKAAIEEMGAKPSGNKSELIQQLLFLYPDAQILSELESQWAIDNEGKEIIATEDYDNALASYAAMGESPIKDARTQVAVLWTDKETGVPMKALLDAENDSEIWDTKTFANPRGLTISRLISSHIVNYHYYRQFAVYDEAMPGKDLNFLFIQTGDSYAYRKVPFSRNLLLFQKGKDDMRAGINLWRDMYEKFGPDRPWVDEVGTLTLKDEAFPMYIYEEDYDD